ncbi:hypothetical protein [Sphaerisporangium siamense]|uniref:Uncharacterized protein n=1 Tax=Sphaerisporangium siamense TaxID=795645 RepID=A0A7W7D8F6_9ACTN|nr:hypothetical protein [Sphaerisporangium siamense]MBB4702223.1 hypothetical protein [Sphaerisporangium siamense]
MPAPEGPALVYVTQGAGATTVVLDRADLSVLAPRERAICRALLTHVLNGLDALEEPRERLVIDTYHQELKHSIAAETAEALGYLTRRA